LGLTTPRFPPPDLAKTPEAFAGLEVSGIPRGLVCVDALVKKDASRVVLANPVSPGKFLILIDGTLAEVEESLLEAERIAGDQTIDRFLLPYAHEQLERGVFGTVSVCGDGSMGLVECATTCAGLRSCDAALKAAPVALQVIHLSAGIGGKCWYAFAGELFDVQASVQAAADVLDRDGRLLGTEVIAAPHPEFLDALGL
jgi:microcompartment protein CcmL/EutN